MVVLQLVMILIGTVALVSQSKSIGGRWMRLYARTAVEKFPGW